MSALGKRKVTAADAAEEEDEVLKARLRAEGWRFLSDADAAPAEPPPPKDLVAAVCQSGGLAAPAVMAALRKAKEEKPTGEAEMETVAQACLAMANLAEREHGRGIVLALGAVEGVVNAMSACTHSASVAAHGCHALANLALGDGAMAVVSGGGVEAAIAAMEGHSDRADVQAKGCLALANASFSDEGEARVLKAGGVRALAQALQGANTDVALAEEVCDCISNLAGGEAGLSALAAFKPWPAKDAKDDETGGLDGLLGALEPLLEAWPQCESVRECVEAIRGKK